jgi:hypothetical protein
MREHRKTLVALIALALLGVLAGSVRADIGQGGGWAWNGTTLVNAFGVCNLVTNYSSTGLFVPTGSSYEWSLFRSYAPSISLSPCTFTIYTNTLTPSGNYIGTYDDFRGGGYEGVSTQQSLNWICQLAGRSSGTGAYACAPNQNPQGCLEYDKNGYCTRYGSTYYYPESRHNGGWGYHYLGQGWCEEGGVQWVQCNY